MFNTYYTLTLTLSYLNDLKVFNKQFVTVRLIKLKINICVTRNKPITKSSINNYIAQTVYS